MSFTKLSFTLLLIDGYYATLLGCGYYTLIQFQLQMIHSGYWENNSSQLFDISIYANIAYVLCLVTFVTLTFAFTAVRDIKDQNSINTQEASHQFYIQAVKGYIYFINTTLLCASNVLIIIFAMVADNSIGNIFTLWVFFCLIIINAFITYYGSFGYITSSFPLIQSLACISVAYVLVILKLYSGFIDTVTASCALLITSIICIPFQYHITQSRVGAGIFNYFKKTMGNQSGYDSSLIQKQKAAFFMTQYYAMWLSFLAVHRGLLLTCHKMLLFGNSLYLVLIIFLIIISLLIVKKMIQLSIVISEQKVYSYVIPFESFVLAQLYVVPFIVSFVTQVGLNLSKVSNIALGLRCLFTQPWDLNLNTLVCNQLIGGGIREHLFKGVTYTTLFGASAQGAIWFVESVSGVVGDADINNKIRVAIIDTESLQKKLPSDSPILPEVNQNKVELDELSSLGPNETAEKKAGYAKVRTHWTTLLCDRATAKQTPCVFEKNATLGSIMEQAYKDFE